ANRCQLLLCLGSRLRRVFVFRQELGDPEIEELRVPFCIRQNVARLDVAMNNQIPMRKFNRGADLQKQLQSLTRRQFLHDCKSGYWCADNVVHDEVGHTIVSGARVEQPRDIWMIELGQDLTFRSEPAQDLSCVRASIQYLDGDLFLKLSISALCQENRAHPAAAKFTDDDIGAHALSAARRSLLPQPAPSLLRPLFHSLAP